MRKLIFIIGCIFSLCGCSDQVPQESDHKECNSMYYWKRVFRLDSAELEFIDRHDIGRIYLRMFDAVVDDYDYRYHYDVFPNATVIIPPQTDSLISTRLRDVEIVPVVYITLPALRFLEKQGPEIAPLMVTRVRNMLEYHGIANAHELQLDCDWTTSTEDTFFDFCREVRSAIDSLDLGWSLSSTIRLHQLSRPVPPVDRGVLMVYNTGNFQDPGARNSIISMEDVAPYLRRLPDYGLHLDVAYPAYSWQLLYRDGEFEGMLSGLDLDDSAYFAPRRENMYAATADFLHNDYRIKKGDLIRNESADADAVIKIKRRIEECLNSPHSNLIYHLDSKNLQQYSDNEIDTILSTNR